MSSRSVWINAHVGRLGIIAAMRCHAMLGNAMSTETRGLKVAGLNRQFWSADWPRTIGSAAALLAALTVKYPALVVSLFPVSQTDAGSRTGSEA